MDGVDPSHLQMRLLCLGMTWRGTLVRKLSSQPWNVSNFMAITEAKRFAVITTTILSNALRAKNR